jgi:hypothetical protein
VHLAKILGVNQAAVSKLERRADMYVSTLQSFVKAMGGELKITARFPEGTVEINQFGDVKQVAGSRSGAVGATPLSQEAREVGHSADLHSTHLKCRIFVAEHRIVGLVETGGTCQHGLGGDVSLTATEVMYARSNP